MDLSAEITYLHGVGPQRATLLQRELQVFTWADLLNHFPFRYIDRSHVSHIANMDINSSYVVLKGVVRNLQVVSSGKFNNRLTASFFDGTGQIDLIWFQGIKWLQESVKTGVEYLLLGKPTLFGDRVQVVHPELEPFVADGCKQNHTFIPVYNTTEKLKAKGLNSKGIGKLVDNILQAPNLVIPETLPQSVLSLHSLMPRRMALRAIHFPESESVRQAATLRLKYEELFLMQLEHQYSRRLRMSNASGQKFSVVGDYFNTFYAEKLPFQLTGAQKRVIHEIWDDMRSGRQMNRLLQGDVGSGKTMVALLSILLAIGNGCQACLMAPTEILAQQHFATFQRLLDGLGLRVELLVGSLKASQKKKIKTALQSGDIHILIGTHALIEDSVVFANLGYVVIDEQHRFGVMQRARLWAKSSVPPHILVMTATPIPRTLAMTLYSDLDYSIIDELPPGRQPIKTSHATDAKRLLLFSFMRKQIAEGRQVYVVYPLIYESKDSDLKDLMDGYESISRAFPLPDYQISIVNGQQDAATKEYEMDRFKKGISNIMVSTTVIEVGVDVPNATVMVIENAERFGLSQLHQLRGRVGRGGGDSYCILMTKDQLSSSAKQRIDTMCSTTDGFLIAEADLRLRGPGDIEGRQQSGMLDFKIADIVDDEPIVSATRNDVKNLLDADPTLSSSDNQVLRRYISSRTEQIDLSKIS